MTKPTPRPFESERDLLPDELLGPAEAFPTKEDVEDFLTTQEIVEEVFEAKPEFPDEVNEIDRESELEAEIAFLKQRLELLESGPKSSLFKGWDKIAAKEAYQAKSASLGAQDLIKQLAGDLNVALNQIKQLIEQNAVNGKVLRDNADIMNVVTDEIYRLREENNKLSAGRYVKVPHGLTQEEGELPDNKHVIKHRIVEEEMETDFDDTFGEDLARQDWSNYK